MYVMFKLDLQEMCSSGFTDGCDAENSVRLSKLSCGKNMIAAKEELYGGVPEVSSKRRTGWCGWKDTVSAPPGNRMMWMEGHCECATRNSLPTLSYSGSKNMAIQGRRRLTYFYILRRDADLTNRQDVKASMLNRYVCRSYMTIVYNIPNWWSASVQ